MVKMDSAYEKLMNHIGHSMKKKIFISLLFFALLGLVASILLTQLHYKSGGMGLDERSFCHVSDFLDCDTVLVSRYSTIASIPNSEIGILYYLLVAIGIFYSWFSTHRRATLGFLFISSLFSVVYSVIMAYLSIFKLGVLCLLCFTAYIASFLLMLLFPKALEIRYRDIPNFIIHYIKSVFGKSKDEFHPRLVFHLVVTIIFFAAGLVFFRGLNPAIHQTHAEIPKEDYLRIFYSLPKKDLHLPERPYWGSKTGPVEIVIFSDFQCPFCRRAAFTLKPYLQEYRDKVHLIYMHYPLDDACNPAMTHPMHPTSCLAAKASICAHQQGKFWEYHDQIFENQKRLSRSTLLEISKNLGLDASKFETCLASDEVTNLLKEDIDKGNQLEVRGTPSVFINGRSFRDWLDPKRLRMVIESEILHPSGMSSPEPVNSPSQQNQ